ncbi:MAG TPA: twin-arginine translocase TatA/TatE family subunit [Tenuifilaceae bacterium]|jgi:sec-independent protein translocase protein TatA|nr:twin-arginine translocase TatA/TatE family subunit [Tenuifilaceae bacterium]
MSAFVIAGQFGVWQIVLIVALILLFFGGKKIPELMRGLGKGIGEFKKGMKENDDDTQQNEKENSK